MTEDLIFDFESKGFASLTSRLILFSFVLIFFLIGLGLIVYFYSFLVNPGEFIKKLSIWSGVSTFIFLSFMLANRLKKVREVSKIIISYQTKRIEIFETNRNSSFIPFDEIKSFFLRTEEDSSSSSNKSSAFYVIYTQKKDGSILTLNWYPNYKTAELVLNELKKTVPLTETSDQTDFGDLIQPDGIEFHKNGSGRFKMTWKSKISFLESILGYGFMISFFSTFLSITLLSDGSILISILFSLLVILFIGLTIYNILRVIKIRGYSLEVKDNSIIYAYKTLTGVKTVKSLPLSDFYQTQIHLKRSQFFDPHRTISVLTKEQTERIEKIILDSNDESKAPALFLESIVLQNKLMDLEFAGYSIVELFQIEKLLDKEFSELKERP